MKGSDPWTDEQKKGTPLPNNPSSDQDTFNDVEPNSVTEYTTAYPTSNVSSELRDKLIKLANHTYYQGKLEITPEDAPYLADQVLALYRQELQNIVDQIEPHTGSDNVRAMIYDRIAGIS